PSSPKRLTESASRRSSAPDIWTSRPSGSCPSRIYATQASVVIVNPCGTRSAPRTRVISATFAPLPPSRSRMSLDPSAKSYTHCVATAVPTVEPILSCRCGAQTNVPVVLGKLGDRPLDLAQGAQLGVRRLRERAPERLDHEAVGFLVERERRGLARLADHAAGGAGEAEEVLALAARGARRQLR